MEKKARMYWLVGTAVWALFMMGMSFQDFKYGLRYHLLHGRVVAEHQAEMAAYEQAVRDGEEGVRRMLRAAKRYDELQFLSLAGRRASRLRAGAHEAPDPAYGSPRAEMRALEATYGKATLRKYREQDSGTEQYLVDEMRARLIVPKMKEPRLAAVLFNMFALPLAIWLALWGYGEICRRIVKYRL